MIPDIFQKKMQKINSEYLDLLMNKIPSCKTMREFEIRLYELGCIKGDYAIIRDLFLEAYPERSIPPDEYELNYRESFN